MAISFTSEHGAPFPVPKWANWNVGIHPAFVVRWPGKVAPGKGTDALIQAEVLYLIRQDTFEFDNLAQDPMLRKIKQRFSDELDAWVANQNDSGAALDSWEVYKKNGGYLDE